MAFVGLVNLLSGAADGYVKGAERQHDWDRQAAIDKIRQDEANRVQADYDRQSQNRVTMTQALRPVTADVIQEPPPMLARPVEEGEVPPPRDWRIGSSLIGNKVIAPDQVPNALAAANSPEAVAARAQAAYQSMGDYEGSQRAAGDAAQAAAARKHMDVEGHIDFVKANLANMPSDAADGTIFPLVGKDAFDANGHARVPANAVGQKFTNANGQPDLRVVDKDTRQPITTPDGTVIPSARTWMNFYDPEQQKRDVAEANIGKVKFDTVDKKEDNRRQAERDAEMARHDKVLEGIEGTKARATSDAAGQGKIPMGYRQLPNGDLEAIHGGPADAKQQGALNQDTQALTGATSSMDRLATAANEVLNHPGLGGIVGFRGVIPNAPGSDAANAQALLGTLKSQVGFGVLQDMRNNSKTGGALGSVSDAEGKRLESNLAALDKVQSLDQMKTSLQKIIDYSSGAKDRLRDAYNLRHGPQSVTPATAPTAPALPAPVGKAPAGWTVVR